MSKSSSKNNLLVDISIAIEPHLLALSNSCTIMIESGKRMREAMDKGDVFVAGMEADELAKASDDFKVNNQALVESAYKVYALHGRLDSASSAAEDAIAWAHAAAMNAGKPVGQA